MKRCQGAEGKLRMSWMDDVKEDKHLKMEKKKKKQQVIVKNRRIIIYQRKVFLTNPKTQYLNDKCSKRGEERRDREGTKD